jgi:hypothetical protein
MSNKKDRTPNDRRSDVKNENNQDFLADAKNREKQASVKSTPPVLTPKPQEKC